MGSQQRGSGDLNNPNTPINRRQFERQTSLPPSLSPNQFHPSSAMANPFITPGQMIPFTPLGQQMAWGQSPIPGHIPPPGPTSHQLQVANQTALGVPPNISITSGALYPGYLGPQGAIVYYGPQGTSVSAKTYFSSSRNHTGAEAGNYWLRAFDQQMYNDAWQADFCYEGLQQMTTDNPSWRDFVAQELAKDPNAMIKINKIKGIWADKAKKKTTRMSHRRKLTTAATDGRPPWCTELFFDVIISAFCDTMTAPSLDKILEIRNQLPHLTPAEVMVRAVRQVAIRILRGESRYARPWIMPQDLKHVKEKEEATGLSQEDKECTLQPAEKDQLRKVWGWHEDIHGLWWRAGVPPEEVNQAMKYHGQADVASVQSTPVVTNMQLRGPRPSQSRELSVRPSPSTSADVPIPTIETRPPGPQTLKLPFQDSQPASSRDFSGRPSPAVSRSSPLTPIGPTPSPPTGQHASPLADTKKKAVSKAKKDTTFRPNSHPILDAQRLGKMSEIDVQQHKSFILGLMSKYVAEEGYLHDHPKRREELGLLIGKHVITPRDLHEIRWTSTPAPKSKDSPKGHPATPSGPSSRLPSTEMELSAGTRSSSGSKGTPSRFISLNINPDDSPGYASFKSEGVALAALQNKIRGDRSPSVKGQVFRRTKCPVSNAGPLHLALWEIAERDMEDELTGQWRIIPRDMRQKLMNAVNLRRENPIVQIADSTRDVGMAAEKARNVHAPRWHHLRTGLEIGVELMSQSSSVGREMYSIIERFERKFGERNITFKVGLQTITLNKKDLSSLLRDEHHDGWLTDQAIFGAMVVNADAHREQRSLPLERSPIVIEPTVWVAWAASMDPQHTPQAVQNVPQDSTFVIPVNVQSSHWVVVLIEMAKKQAAVLDSMNVQTTKDTIQGQVDQLWKSVGHTELEWKVVKSIEQPNGNDCGMYAIYNVDSLTTKGKPQNAFLTFSDRSIILFRLWAAIQNSVGDNSAKEALGENRAQIGSPRKRSRVSGSDSVHKLSKISKVSHR